MIQHWANLVRKTFFDLLKIGRRSIHRQFKLQNQRAPHIFSHSCANIQLRAHHHIPKHQLPKYNKNAQLSQPSSTLEGFRARDNFDEFSGNLGLTGSVVLKKQLADHFTGVFGGVVHGLHTR